MARFPALAFLLTHPSHGAMLFDTGYSRHFLHATRGMPERLYRAIAPPRLGPKESLQQQLERDGIDASHIGTVMLSHLHGDHIGGLRDFPHSALLCSRQGWNDLNRRSRLAALSRGMLPALLPDGFGQDAQWIEDLPSVPMTGVFEAFATGYDLWNDGSMLAIPLPGHAAGHYGLLFQATSGEHVFLVADAVWSSTALLDGVPPPSFVTSWLGDTAAYIATLEQLRKLRRDAPDLRIVPSHCDMHRP
ncbi:MBL fold metallo-hydrolase [Dyella sp. 2RAB6]|uniref:MBL fold metallo-hydrolase n=1 Tax=Dyella sp. 2RAB6 TaxID=3232992 RepID=UPI003F933D12